jgi:hypothetical protein
MKRAGGAGGQERDVVLLVGGGKLFRRRLLVTSWSSHCTKIGTSALKARTLSSRKLYLCAARNSSSVSATFAFSGIVTFFQILSPGNFTSAAMMPSA